MEPLQFPEDLPVGGINGADGDGERGREDRGLPEQMVPVQRGKPLNPLKLHTNGAAAGAAEQCPPPASGLPLQIQDIGRAALMPGLDAPKRLLMDGEKHGVLLRYPQYPVPEVQLEPRFAAFRQAASNTHDNVQR